MAYPTKFNNQYKAEKKAGTTTAKSFPEWYENYKLCMAAPITVNDEVVEEETPTPEVVETPVILEKKAAKARRIYDEMDAETILTNTALIRKNIIDRFMAELPISKVGASTYLQNIKLKRGLVTPKSRKKSTVDVS